MASGIYELDTCTTLEPTWHRTETIKEVINYETSQLDWTVEKRNITIAPTEEESINVDLDAPEVDRTINGWFAIHCPEKNHTINVARDSYTVIPNDKLFEIIEDSLVGVRYKIVSAGSIGNLAKVYISVALEENQDYLVNKEEFKNILSFVSSHDGSLNLECYDSAIRVVCKNTLQWSRQQKGILNLRIRHTKNADIRIENMKEQIDKLFQKRMEFYSSYEAMCARPMSREMAEKILIGFEVRDDVSTRARNKVNQMVELFDNGLGNKGETVADLLNGVTEYYTTANSKNLAKAWASSEFGQGAKRKLEFFDAITDDRLDALARRGEKLLELAGV